MKKVFVIIYSSGQYEDYREQCVVVVKDKRTAGLLVKKANKEWDKWKDADVLDDAAKEEVMLYKIQKELSVFCKKEFGYDFIKKDNYFDWDGVFNRCEVLFLESK